MIINTVMAVVNPDMPKTNLSQPLFVHVPVASSTSKGIASYKETDFIVGADGQVALNFDSIPLPTFKDFNRLDASVSNLGNLYSDMSSDLNNPTTGLKARVSTLEENIPLPTENDKGKILGVSSDGKYTFIELEDGELGTGEITLIKVDALPTDNILTYAIYELTQNIDGVVYTYYFIYSGIWQQLNASYIESASVNANFPNGIYFSQGETFVVNNGTVYKLLNNADYSAINASIQDVTQLAESAENKATSAETTANTAQNTANTAQNTAQEALNKANSVSSAFRAQGSVSTITSMAQPSSATVGYVYNITQPFTTTSQFVEGAGITYPAGTNVAIIQQVGGYYYDVFAGFIDLSNYQTLLVSGTNIKTINNQSLLGSGNIAIQEIVSTAPLYNTGADIPLTINNNNTAYIRLPLYNGETE